jgi:proteasome lid subunit RPN8/RPN11
MRLDPLIPSDLAAPPAMRFGAPTLGLTDELRGAILDHAQSCSPRECCGLVFRVHGEAGLRYAPGENLAAEPGDTFRLDPDTWAACEDAGEVVAIVHSHPNESANPSDADGVGCEVWGLPWLIAGWPSGVIVQLDPSGWRAPLQGRQFHFGVLDCWQLVRDFFARELATELPDFARHDDFWLPTDERPARNLVHEHLAAAGFELVTDGALPRRGDVLLMRIRSLDIDNHLAVYLGDSRFLHTQPGRLSKVEVWGSSWQRHTMGIARHRSLA